MPAWLPALLLAAFALYTDDYVIAGVLPEIAGDLAVPVGAAGQLVTAFSVTVAVAAPVAAVALARVQPRRLLGAALGVFVVANALAALTPSFAALLLLRILAALTSAAATPTLFAVAAAGAPQGRTGRYLAVVSLGVTGSVTAGVPAGTWIGGAFGWRSTFLVMAATGVVAALALLRTLPDRATRGTPPSLRRRLQVLASSPIALGLAANTLLIGGSMMLLTYLAPFVAGIAQADTGVRGLLFAVSGVAGTVGIWAGGLATDRWGADRAIAVGAGAVLTVMACFALLWSSRPVSIVLVGALTTVWGGAAFWYSPGVQARLHELAGAMAPQALALNTSATHLGVALGGAVGGALLTGPGPGALPVASGLFVLAALVVLLLADRPGPAASRDRPHDRRGAGPGGPSP